MIPFMNEEVFNFRKIVKTSFPVSPDIECVKKQGATSPQHKNLELAEVTFLRTESVLILCSC